ncbi:alpha/beta hydrolase [Halovulum sp. GXIMD14794]
MTTDISRAVRAIAGALCLLLASCSVPPEIVGIDNPEVPVASVPGATRHKVFIATTREDSEVVGALFSDLRADELGLASVEVSIPPTHVEGDLERPRKLPPDPRTEFAIVSPAIYANDTAFISAMNREFDRRSRENRDALFFVHGYNTTTTEAILRVAQFVEDSGFEGVPILFTWASAGKTTRYVYDLNSALVARPLVLDAAHIVTRTKAEDYHIFAHSMGGFLTMEAIVDAAQLNQFDRTGRLRTIVLASPDIDIDLFRSQVGQMRTTFDRFFVLLSKDDYALRASRFLAGGVPRVGAADAEALANLGVTAIDLTEINDSRTDSHSKFAGSPEVVQLIGRGLNAIPEYGRMNRTALDDLLGNAPIQVVRGGS